MLLGVCELIVAGDAEDWQSVEEEHHPDELVQALQTQHGRHVLVRNVNQQPNTALESRPVMIQHL